METPTPFELNRAIQGWRENLGQSPALQSENLNELESHLRDSVATLQTRGLSSEESFMVATSRIGKGHSLETEFTKVNGHAIWVDRFLWMVIGVQFWHFFMGIAGTVGRGVVCFGLTKADYDFSAHGPGIPVVLFITANLSVFVGSLVLCRWLMCRKGETIGQWSARILQRRATWAMAFGALCVVSFSEYVINILGTAFILKISTPEMLKSVSISAHSANLLQFAILLALTFFLARKRLHLSRA